MTSWLGQRRLELLRRVRKYLGEPEAVWPKPPAGTFLNPSDADFAAYEGAALTLTWRLAGSGDAAAWQEKVRAKLRELMGIQSASAGRATALSTPPITMEGGLRRQTFYLPTVPRRHVPLTIVWDPAAADRFLPVMLCLQGHVSGAHISWGETRLPIDALRIANGGDFALQAVRHRYVAICIEQIGFGERREQAITHRWDHPCVDACNRALLLGRTVLGDRVADVMAAIDWLRSGPSGLPRINLNAIRAMGNSAGGETALFAMALDPRVEATIASGCVGPWRKANGARRTCPDTIIPGVLAWIEYSDVLALCAPRSLLVVSGVEDHIFPFALANECVEDARPVYSAMEAASRLQAIAGPGEHRFYPDIAWPAFAALLDAKTQ